MLRLLGYYCFFMIIFGSGKADAQHRTALDELFYPNTELKVLT